MPAVVCSCGTRFVCVVELCRFQMYDKRANILKNLFIVFHAEACPRCACCIGRSTYQEPPPASNDQLRAFKRAEQLMKRQIREQWYDLSKEVKRRGEACNSSALSTEDHIEQTHCSLTVIIKATSGVSLLA